MTSIDDRFLRSDKIDKEILATKIIEIFLISTAPFLSFNTSFLPLKVNFLKEALEHLITIASIDYALTESENKLFHDDVITLLDQSKSYMDLTDESISVSLIGRFELDLPPELDSFC